VAKNGASQADVVLAAGGIVWRDAPRGRELAVIHRPRYQDWTLPKGKLESGERWQKGARREVREETGFEVELREFAGACGYMTRNAPKVVLFWHMEVVGEPRFQPEDRHEVDGVEWLTVPEAIRKLTHLPEKRLLAEATAPQGPPVPESSGSEVVTSPFRPPQTPEGTVSAKKPAAAAAGTSASPGAANGVARAASRSRRGSDEPQSRRGFLTRVLGSRGKRR
jgi:ADP-ribose pyrophosphatase YjhB (NUDIX family)